MRKKYTLEIDQPNFNPNERLQAVVDYFVELGKSVVVENLHTVIIEGERYRILSRSENSSVIKTLFTPNLVFTYMIRLEKIKWTVSLLKWISTLYHFNTWNCIK